MTTPEWAPERVVDPPLAAQLIAGQFPELAGAPLTPLGAGWDNTAYLAGGVVFRFPRRQMGVDLLEYELSVLPEVAPRVPLPIPDPSRYRGRPSDGFPWPWMGYPALEGEPAGDGGAVPLRADQAPRMGAFLRELHAFPVDRRRLRGDTLLRGDIAARKAKWGPLPAKLAAEGVLDAEPAQAVTALLHDTPDDLPQRPDTLVHGDLYSRHLLIGKDGTVTGVIDWGDVHLGDPAQDLSIAFAFPPEAHAAFQGAYGGVDDATWARARFWATWHACVVLEYAVSENLPLIAQSSRAVLSITTLADG